jgi:hypothetical protein
MSLSKNKTSNKGYFLGQQQFTKNEIYFATVDNYPFLAKIGFVIPRRLEVAIDKKYRLFFYRYINLQFYSAIYPVY